MLDFNKTFLENARGYSNVGRNSLDAQRIQARRNEDRQAALGLARSETARNNADAKVASSGLEMLKALPGLGLGASSPSSPILSAGMRTKPPGVTANSSAMLDEAGVTNPPGASGLNSPDYYTSMFPKQFKTGGLIDGPPPPPDGSDNVDIKAKAGEYVLPPEAVDMLGLDFLDRIVQTATGHPPVHGGMPTEEGKPGFWSGGLTALPDKLYQTGYDMDRTGGGPNLLHAGVAFANESGLTGAAQGLGQRFAEGGPKYQERKAQRMLREGPETQADYDWARGIDRSGPQQTYPMPGLAGLTGDPSDTPQAWERAVASGAPAAPGDNVQFTGITGRDSAGNLKRIYVNRFEPGTPEYEKYGAAIYSDSWTGATQKGFEEAYSKTGNYVGDPATGKGLHLPETVGRGARMGLGEMRPQEVATYLQAYTPARQANAQNIRDQANLATMRQWQGQSLAAAPDQVRELYGKPPSTETTINRYLARELSPEAQAARAQQVQSAGKKSAGNGNPTTAYTKDLLSAFKDGYGDNVNDMALSIVSELAPAIQQYESDPQAAASLLYRATMGFPAFQSLIDEAQSERSMWRGQSANDARVRAAYEQRMKELYKMAARNLELMIQGKPPLPPTLTAR